MKIINMLVACIAICLSGFAIFEIENVRTTLSSQLEETKNKLTTPSQKSNAVRADSDTRRSKQPPKSTGDSQVDSKHDLEKLIRNLARVNDSQWSDIDYLKSERTLHQKEISQLKNELQNVIREFKELKRRAGNIDR